MTRVSESFETAHNEEHDGQAALKPVSKGTNDRDYADEDANETSILWFSYLEVRTRALYPTVPEG